MISVVIQAGGRSSRMGQDKGLLPVGGVPIVERIADCVAGIGEEMLVVSNTPERYLHLGLPIVSDEVPGAGALPGLRTALQAATGDYVLLVACDMPFLNRELLCYLLRQTEGVDAVVPMWNERFQTMHAVYAREPGLVAVDKALDRGDQRMISTFKDLRMQVVPAADVARFDPEGLSFFNVNTPDDLARAEQIWTRLTRDR